jgi:hypothetical protein
VNAHERHAAPVVRPIVGQRAGVAFAGGHGGERRRVTLAPQLPILGILEALPFFLNPASAGDRGGEHGLRSGAGAKCSPTKANSLTAFVSTTAKTMLTIPRLFRVPHRLTTVVSDAIRVERLCHSVAIFTAPTERTNGIVTRTRSSGKGNTSARGPSSPATDSVPAWDA